LYGIRSAIKRRLEQSRGMSQNYGIIGALHLWGKNEGRPDLRDSPLFSTETN
jgi:hypothetical protein